MGLKKIKYGIFSKLGGVGKNQFYPVVNGSKMFRNVQRNYLEVSIKIYKELI